jgi:hypothetical protein
VGKENTLVETKEHERLHSDDHNWKRWGPYLSERAWGTVREDYSEDGNAWMYFPHDQARSRTYRWNEDGLAGISDEEQIICFALALWNGQDPILKERMFGLAGPEGNHGEDVKEYYFYLDSTPTHSYMKMLYKYPQKAYPYDDLVHTNRWRGKEEPEYELIDTGVFNENRYFDVFVEYAKAAPKDILIRISAINCGPDAAPLHVLPTLWYRNNWSWHRNNGAQFVQPTLRAECAEDGKSGVVFAENSRIGRYVLAWECAKKHAESLPETLFTNNETNVQRLFDYPNPTPYVKDGINNAIVQGALEAVNPEQTGTKAAVHYRLDVPPGATATVCLRLTASDGNGAGAFDNFHEIFAERIAEADAFYAANQPATLSDDERLVQRQAFAGMLWTKQFFHYDVAEWLRGDSAQPPPPDTRSKGRNSEWYHVSAHNVISMPDKWEYPWFAAWDLAFHCVTLALVDLDFAKDQLLLMCQEWFQHPNGQIAAYEWAFGDVNPPVLAWAAVEVYAIESRQRGKGDRSFLSKMFQKLALNFTWWVNRKDEGGTNLFGGGFLGLDNIGIFDRSAPLPTGGYIEQSDGTSWMAMFCIYMIDMALELSKEDAAYEDIFLKYVYHFIYITSAMQNIGEDKISLWDNQDQFFYDVLRFPSHGGLSLKVRSMVGLIPAYAVLTFEPVVLRNWAEYYQRIQWFVQRRPELSGVLTRMLQRGKGDRFMLSFCREEQLLPISRYLLDESEFLSPYGVRALSRYHAEHPYTMNVHGVEYRVDYMPAESNSGMFGGNSNWRGPIWMPVNYLLIESLRRYYLYYGDEITLECPTGSGRYLTLDKVADELSQRLINIFTRDEHGRRAVFGDVEYFQNDPHWRDYITFYEYFHGDTGRGVGASHQTGWTGLVASLIQEQGERREQHQNNDQEVLSKTDKKSIV